MSALPFYLAMGGLIVAWYIYMINPAIAESVKARFHWLYTILDRKYGFDEFNQAVFAAGSRGIGKLFWTVGDRGLIDGLIVNGSAKTVGWFAERFRNIQSGYLYHYAIAMIVGLLALLTVFVAI
jgi:NADH-quinone oxidoreductase subunit L